MKQLLFVLLLASSASQARGIRQVHLIPTQKGACKWCGPSKPRKPRLPKGGPAKFKQLKFKPL